MTSTSAPPMDPAALDAAMRPFGRSTMLPAEAYTSPVVLEWEQRHFFAATWVCVGAARDLRAEGVTQRATTRSA